MANYNLAGQKIKDTYQQVAQVSGSTLVNGSGTAAPIATSSIVSFDTEVSRSAAAAGFGAGGSIDTSSLTPLSTFNAYTSSNDSVVDALVAATSSYLTSLPSGVVSSSAQVDLSQATGTAANAVSSSYATSALSASYAPGTSLPSGLVSSSAQISYTGITDVPSGIVSSSSQVDLSQATGTAANATSASYSLTASYAENAGGGAAFPFTGSAGIQGNLDMNSAGALVVSDYTGSLASTSILIGQNFNDPTRINTAGDRNVQIGYYSRIVESNQRDNVVVIGADAEAAQNSTAIGKGAISFAEAGVALGYDTKVYNNFAVAMAGGNAQGQYSFAVGAVTTTQNYEINIQNKLKYNAMGSGSLQVDGAVSSPTQTLSGVGGAVNINGGLSNFFTLAAGGNSYQMNNPTNLMDGVTYTIKITNGQNLTWDSNYKFEGGVAPSLTSGTDIVSFASFGDGILYCSYLLNLS